MDFSVGQLEIGRRTRGENSVDFFAGQVENRPVKIGCFFLLAGGFFCRPVDFFAFIVFQKFTDRRKKSPGRRIF